MNDMVENNVPDTVAGSESEQDKKQKKKENRLEIPVAVFLGITSILIAWTVWIGSIHGGNQTANYTLSTDVASVATGEYNNASQVYTKDMMIWNTIQDYMFEKAIADHKNEEVESQMIQDKIDKLIKNNCSQEMQEAVAWAFEQDPSGNVSPFTKEGFSDSYFSKASELLEESRSYMEQGKNDSRNADRYNLVTVIYSTVLFLLGIVGIFKRLPNRRAVFWIAVGLLAAATIFMCTIPLPTDFNLWDYFKN